MKKMIMVLAVVAFAYSGAEAKERSCKCAAKTTNRVVKKADHKPAACIVHPVQNTTVTTEVCRILPYEVCKIMPDRKTVRCYKTTDLDNLTPMNNEVTWYGPNGKMPGSVEKSGIRTVVIQGTKTQDGCKSNLKNRTTVCTLTDKLFLTRDACGNYSYRDNKYNYSYR